MTAAASREYFDNRARVLADDEIGSLERAFNLMCERLSRSREELRRKERWRVQLLQKVITAQEEERKRVARELHDHTSQQLATVAVQLKALETVTSPEQARDRARQLRELVAQTSESVRGLAVELRPSLLDDLGFVAAIERHCQTFQEQLGIPVDLQVVGHWDQSLPPEVETTLYRICQEALTNAARHAEPTHVSVLLTRRPDSAVAIIEDEGQGFEVEEVLTDPRAERHLGLFGMQERAALVGGKLTLESAPGQGTTVFVEIPCRGAAEENIA